MTSGGQMRDIVTQRIQNPGGKAGLFSLLK
jgi:hypothetical protein